MSVHACAIPTHVWFTPHMSQTCDTHGPFKLWVICTVLIRIRNLVQNYHITKLALKRIEWTMAPMFHNPFHNNYLVINNPA